MIDTDRIKAGNPIEEVVARYVRLRRRGRTLVGLCPFHREKKPSFTVWPGGGWYCFGCGEGGDVIDFIMKILNVDFREACRVLGAGDLPELTSPPPTVEAPVEAVELGRAERQALGLAVRVYHARLWSLPLDHPARRYLEDRRIDPDTVRRFAIGWCSGHDLIPALRFVRMRQQVFLDTGLLGERAGQLREFLRGRIVVPDRAPNGTVLHMVGRSLGSEEPRYLSLPGLPKPPYGLSGVRRQEPVAVVEGIFCRLSLERHGVQAVAVMGTALRGERARALKAVPDLHFVPQNDDLDEEGPTVDEWLESPGVRRSEAAARWLRKVSRSGRERLTKGQAAVLEWLLAVGHGKVVELPSGVKDVNDLDQAGGMEAWLDTWAGWRERR